MTKEESQKILARHSRGEYDQRPQAERVREFMEQNENNYPGKLAADILAKIKSGDSTKSSPATLTMSDTYADDDHRYEAHPAEPRARMILWSIIEAAKKKFAADPKNKDEADFISRIGEGDLKAKLWNAITERLPSNGPNKAIREIVLSEVKKLWRHNPPAPEDRLDAIFSGD